MTLTTHGSMARPIIIGKNASGGDAAFDLDALLRTRLLVQANSGGGKSWLLRRLAEQLFGQAPVFIVDPDGDFATLRERFGYVLAGKGGETPADPRSAAMLAEKLLELHASAVCDLYELKPHDRHRWVRLFLEGMMNAPKQLWQPAVVIVDEAHLWCPERGAGESEASAAMIDLATRGRRRGFCAVWATQRLGKLRKDAAAELTNVMVGKTFIDVDRDRAAEILGVRRCDRADFDQQVRGLRPGQFFCLGAAVSTERLLAQVGPVATRHPEAGSAALAVPPPAPEQVRALLPKLGDLPQAAEERARGEAELRAEVRSLRAQLAARPVAAPTTEATERAVERALGAARRDWERERANQLREIARLRAGAGELAKLAALLAESGPTPAPAIVGPAPRPAPSLPRLNGRPAAPPRRPPSDKLRAGAERMLAALCQWSPQGMMPGQMRAHAGMKKSGTFAAYMRDLRTGGFIEERGGLLYATPSALGYFGEVPPAPATTAEVLAVWAPKLREGARRMLEALVDAGGATLAREELQRRAGLANSGTFAAYLSDLKTAQLAVATRNGIAANRETLFL